MKLFTVIFLTLLTSTLLGHGVTYKIFDGGYGVKISYEDGSPIDFADVQIFRPGESEYEFQRGLTDENGVFMFMPDSSGSWTVKISDGLGHGKVIGVMVDKKLGMATGQTSLSRLQTIISGLGYILFGFTSWYIVKLRQKEPHAHS